MAKASSQQVAAKKQAISKKPSLDSHPVAKSGKSGAGLSTNSLGSMLPQQPDMVAASGAGTSSVSPLALGPYFISSPYDLFVSEIKETYWAERHLLVALPKMIDAASDSQLQAALQEHLTLTATHVVRLEQVLGILGEDLVAKKCAALEGLAISGENVIDSTQPGSAVRDSGIIGAGIKVEHFEATTYKGLIKQATSLGQSEIADLLSQTLTEEEEAGDLLEDLMDANLNPETI